METSMRIINRAWPWLLGLAALAVMTAVLPAWVEGACCYFSAKDADILQPAQKAFLTWDPQKKQETFTVQPKFEGNALDFGMVIPTPSRPKLHEMPKDFFKNLALYSILKKSKSPHHNPLPYPVRESKALNATVTAASGADPVKAVRPPAIKILEAGVVGSLDYKIIEAGRADDLFAWLKDHKYSY